MPEVAGLPFVITGLVMAGGLAAALSTADGLLLTIANAFSHDLYYNVIDPKASLTKRLTITKVLLVITALIAAWVSTFPCSDHSRAGRVGFQFGGRILLSRSGHGHLVASRQQGRGLRRHDRGSRGDRLLYDRQPLLRRFMVWHSDHCLGGFRTTGRFPDDLDRVALDRGATQACSGSGGKRSLSQIRAGYNLRSIRPRGTDRRALELCPREGRGDLAWTFL